MNDLERIKEIEKISGVTLHRVENLQHLATEGHIIEDLFQSGTRNYCLDNKENVIGLSLFSIPINQSPYKNSTTSSHISRLQKIMTEFSHIIHLQIINVPFEDYSFFKEMKELVSLTICNNKLSNIDFFEKLECKLTYLDLSFNELSEISILEKFNGLKSLNLSGNKIQNFIFLNKLKYLQSLVLKHNNLADVYFLQNLKGLKFLNLGYNNLTEIDILKKIKKLTYLDLSNNQIKILPEWIITELDLEIKIQVENSDYSEHKVLLLKDNPIENPPLYIVQRGKETIKKYFQHKGDPYLDSFLFKNYFSIADIEIKNLSDKKEIYFLGENGDGKTILLQAITLALKGNQNFGAISDVLKDNLFMLKEKNEKNLELIQANLGKKEELDSVLKSIDSFGYEKQFNKDHEISYPHLNVYAYGINRVFNKNDETRDDENKEVYLSLFDHRYGLTDPVQWLKDIRLLTLENKDKGLPEPTVTLPIAQQLLSELVNKEIEIKFSGTSVTFSEKGSQPISYRQLSDGYKSIINWLCDLLSRLSKNQPHVKKLEDYYGIVLVDEIGVYLHPRLQFTLVGMLRKKFKKIQWIFTTHSPIITLGASASEDTVFFKLYKENGKTQIAGPVNGIAGMTANSLITSILWRLDEFTTQGTNINQINSDDYIYKVIHDAIRERIKKNINLSDKDTAQMVQKLLDNLKTLESKITQDLDSDISAANELIDA